MSAPGTPPVDALPVVWVWLVCEERSAETLGSWFGLNVSATDSLRVKSMSAVTCTRTLLRPTMGSRMSVMRWIVDCSTCFT